MTARAIGMSVAQIGVKASVAGAVGTGVSWFFLDRKQYVQVFGYQMREAYADGALIAVSSAGSDLIAHYAASAVEKALGVNGRFTNFANMMVGPALTGTGAFVKKIVVGDNGELAKDYILFASADVAGGYVSKAMGF